MTLRRPEIFVSATSQDLRTCRQLIKEALLTLGCTPVEQTNFPPEARTVQEMLRAKITACDAVVHVAGEVYGAEPRDRDPADSRRSYTQLEYDLAKELGKPVYVFVCGAGFPYDEHAPEDAEKQSLQQEHRAHLQQSDHHYTPVSSRDELALRIHALQTRVESLSGELKKTRSWLGRGVAIGLLALALLGGGLWWLNQRTGRTEAKVVQLESALDQQRRYIKSVADAYTQQQSELEKLKLTDEQKFDRALAAVASKEKIPEADLRSGINLFVAAIKADPKSDFYDRALAEFAQKNFTAAAASAGQAATVARDQYLAADKLAAQAAEKADEARTRARNAFSLQGQAFYAARKFPEAVTAYEAGLAATPRATHARDWAYLQSRIGLAANEWAGVSTGDAIARRNAQSADAFRAALEIYTREAFPQDWAKTEDNLANTLRDQASASSGPEHARLLAESAAAHRATLAVLTRQDLPQNWAATQNNLGGVLNDQAAASTGAERDRLMAEAIAAFRAALEVRTRDTLPKDWALTQSNLAEALRTQAAGRPQPDRLRLLTEAIAAHRASLEVRTRTELPEDWAMSQLNLGAALSDLADDSTGPERARLLAESIAAERAALEVYTRGQFPQDWAMVQVNLGASLRTQATDSSGPERAQLLTEAGAAYRSALSVYTRAALPQYWATIQYNLDFVLRDQAAAATGPERTQLLAERVAANRAALEVRTREAFPRDWASSQHNLAGALRTQAADTTGPEHARLLRAAIAAERAAMEIFTAAAYPNWYQEQVAWITAADAELSRSAP